MIELIEPGHLSVANKLQPDGQMINLQTPVQFGANTCSTPTLSIRISSVASRRKGQPPYAPQSRQDREMCTDM